MPLLSLFRPAARASASALALAVLLLLAPAGRASEPEAKTAVQSLVRLKEGNARFAADPSMALPIVQGRREALAGGQDPFAVVLSCADSRVPPEVIFNTGLGDLFVIRAAGEVLDRSVIASIEYGAEHLKTPLLVVMGHEFCGAVKAAAETTPGSKSMGPNLDFLIKAIQPAVARTARTLFEEPLKAAVLANVEQIIGDLQTQSAILRHLIEGGELQIIGAYDELSSGRVAFSQPVGGSRPAPARVTRSSTKPLIEIQELQPGRSPAAAGGSGPAASGSPAGAPHAGPSAGAAPAKSPASSGPASTGHDAPAAPAKPKH